jgi:hypothetical protein
MNRNLSCSLRTVGLFAYLAGFPKGVEPATIKSASEREAKRRRAVGGSGAGCPDAFSSKPFSPRVFPVADKIFPLDRFARSRGFLLWEAAVTERTVLVVVDAVV